MNLAQAVITYMTLVAALLMFVLRLYGLLAHNDDLAATRFFGSKVLGVILIILMVLFHRCTPMKLNWNGLTGKKEDIIASLKGGVPMAVIVVVILLAYRAYLNTKYPESRDIPWFGLYLNVNARWLYPFHIPFQELFIKSYVQENIAKVFDEKQKHLPVIVTSLFFFILHVQYPVYYMFGAFLLCLATGYLYRKYPSIWGPALVHFAIGFLPRCLGIFQIIER